MSKLIATDLDGTLFYPKHRVKMISKKSIDFLRSHIDRGGRVVIVSGRNVNYSLKVVRRIDRPVDIISCNSSAIFADGKLVKETCFDPNEMAPIMKEIEEEFHPVITLLMTSEGNYCSKKSFTSIIYRVGYRLWYMSQGVYKEPFVLDNDIYNAQLQGHHVYKIMIMIGIGKKNREKAGEINKILREKYKGKLEASWTGEFIELSPSGCSKAEGLKHYTKHLNIAHDDVYVVGDSGNDISMFLAFPEHSFCMSHASLSVSKYAKHSLKRFVDLENYLYKEAERK